MLKPKPKLMQPRWEQRKVLSQDDHKGLDYMNWMSDKKVSDWLTFEW
jgi:hypothetical protein